MQISPASALFKALSSLPVSGATPAPAATPVQPPAAAQGALAAAQKALAQRAQNQPAPVPAQGGQPPRNLPRGSIVNIVV